jgi:hypothetical protein
MSAESSGEFAEHARFKSVTAPVPKRDADAVAYIDRVFGGGACEGQLTRHVNAHENRVTYTLHTAKLGPRPDLCQYCALYVHCPIIDAAIAHAKKAAEETASENSAPNKPEGAKP